MSSLFGCLFVLFFGFIIVAFSLLRSFFNVFFGRTPRNFWGGTNNSQGAHGTASSGSRQYTSAGDAHREGSHGNSRQRRSKKIFEKNEGKYVDFEEV